MKFFKTNWIVKILVLGSYLFVNNLFLYKYASNYPIFLMIFYTLFVVGGFVFYSKTTKKNNPKYFILRYGMGILLSLFILGIIFIKVKLPAEDVMVDRWSALYNWSEYLFQGKYPYASVTHLGQYASPFPVWEILHIPFYLLRDEIYAHIILLSLLFWILKRIKLCVDGFLFFVMLIVSPCYWWEIAVRSDLMNNMLVSLIFIVVSERYIQNCSKKIQYGWFGLIVGGILCTRLFTIFPLGIYFISKLFTWNKKDVIRFVLCATIGFLLPMIPFIIWDMNMYVKFKYSPIHLQTQFGNPLIAILGMIFLAFCSNIWYSIRDCFGLIALVLFVFISVRFGQEWLEQDWLSVVKFDRFDISYFNVCIPFAILFLCWRKGANSILIWESY